MKRKPYEKCVLGTSLAFQWLRPWASDVERVGSIPGWGTEIPHAACYGKRKRERENERKKKKNVLLKHREARISRDC